MNVGTITITIAVDFDGQRSLDGVNNIAISTHRLGIAAVVMALRTILDASPEIINEIGRESPIAQLLLAGGADTAQVDAATRESFEDAVKASRSRYETDHGGRVIWTSLDAEAPHDSATVEQSIQIRTTTITDQENQA